MTPNGSALQPLLDVGVLNYAVWRSWFPQQAGSVLLASLLAVSALPICPVIGMALWATCSHAMHILMRAV